MTKSIIEKVKPDNASIKIRSGYHYKKNVPKLLEA